MPGGSQTSLTLPNPILFVCLSASLPFRQCNTLTIKKANINILEEYIIVSNEIEKVYLDNKGNIIKDTTKLKQINNPEKIGEYEKEQFSIEKIYYVKK